MHVARARHILTARRGLIGLGATSAVMALAAAGAGTAGPVSASTVTASKAAPSALPLSGKIIGIDPGHNGRNWTDPAYLNHKIWNGREWEGCDTTGTQTASGYTEARFTFNVALILRRLLRADGAKVVMTRTNNHGLGPCVNRRAFILNRGHAVVSIDIHADYGPSSGRGFTVLEPVADGPNDKVIKPSLRFGRDVHLAFVRHTPMPVSDYYGHKGYIFRNDLAGLNLTTMPKVLIETGNMNNSTDGKLLATTKVQREIAHALLDAIIRFLAGK